MLPVGPPTMIPQSACRCRFRQIHGRSRWSLLHSHSDPHHRFLPARCRWSRLCPAEKRCRRRRKRGGQFCRFEIIRWGQPCRLDLRLLRAFPIIVSRDHASSVIEQGKRRIRQEIENAKPGRDRPRPRIRTVLFSLPSTMKPAIRICSPVNTCARAERF